MSRRTELGRSTVAVLFSLLLATSGVSLAASPSLAVATSPTDGGTAVSSVAAGETAQTTVTLRTNGTQTYNLTRDGDAVNVTLEVAIPEEPTTVDIDLPFDANVVRAEGGEEDGGSVSVDKDVDNVTIVYQVRPNGMTEAVGDSWATFETFEPTIRTFRSDYEVDAAYDHRLGGDGFRRGDRFYLGGYERHEAWKDGNMVEVIVSDEVNTSAPPKEIAWALANASERVDTAAADGNVTAYAIPRVAEGVGGRADGTDTFLIASPKPLYDVPNAWFHEYMHTTEDVRKGEKMKWFLEGYATSRTWVHGTAMGYGDYDEFQTVMSKDLDDPSVLANNYTWDSRTEYEQGGLVLTAIDKRIRETTDDHTLADVVARMHDLDDDGQVTLNEFLSAVEAVSNREVREDAELWIQTRRTPDTWTQAEHNRVFGPTPRIEHGSVTDVTVSSSAGTRPAGTDTTIDLIRNESLNLEVNAVNTGNAGGYERLWGDNFTKRGEFGSKVVYVPADSTTRTTLSWQFNDTGQQLVYIDGEMRVVDVSLPPIEGTTPQDLDDDGLYMDLDGDGEITDNDGQLFSAYHHDPVMTDHLSYYDYDGDGKLSTADAMELAAAA